MKNRFFQFLRKFSIQTWIILGALILLFVFRLIMVKIVILDPSRGIFIDSEQYLELARNLFSNGTYHSDSIPDLDLLRPPGYPIFLALILGITGGSLSAVLIIQFIVVFITAYLIYEIGNMLGRQKVGLTAGLLLLLSPNTLFWSVTFMTESLFSVGLILSFLWIVKDGKNQTSLWSIGILIGISTLIRPIGLYLIPLWTCWMFFSMNKMVGKKIAIRKSASFLLAAMLILLPWFVRNYFKHGTFALSNVSSMTVSSFHLALTLEDAENMSWEEAKVHVAMKENNWSTFHELITSYPKSLFKVQFRGIARVLIGMEIGTWSSLVLDTKYEGSGILDAFIRGDFESLRKMFLNIQSLEELPQLLFLIWGSGYSILLFCMAVFGIIRWVRRSNSIMHNPISLAFITSIYLVLSTGAAGEARFRVPVEPFLALFAALTFFKKSSEEIEDEKTNLD